MSARDDGRHNTYVTTIPEKVAILLPQVSKSRNTRKRLLWIIWRTCYNHAATSSEKEPRSLTPMALNLFNFGLIAGFTGNLKYEVFNQVCVLIQNPERYVNHFKDLEWDMRDWIGPHGPYWSVEKVFPRLHWGLSKYLLLAGARRQGLKYYVLKYYYIGNAHEFMVHAAYGYFIGLQFRSKGPKFSW